MIRFLWMLEPNRGGSLWCKGMSSITEIIEQGYILRGELSLLSWKLALLSAPTEGFKSTYIQRPQTILGTQNSQKRILNYYMERENLCISFLSWLSSSCCWWHQIKLWLLGKSGVVAWARCSFQLWIFVYSAACNPFCLLPEAGPPSLISGHKWRFPHAHFPSVCVESLPAVDGAGNAQRRVQVLIKPSLSWKMGPGDLGIKCSNFKGKLPAAHPLWFRTAHSGL